MPRLSENEVDYLLLTLCERFGICLPAIVGNMLKANPPENDVAFTDAVLEAEGFEPEYVERKFYRNVYAVVAKAFDAHEEAHQPS